MAGERLLPQRARRDGTAPRWRIVAVGTTTTQHRKPRPQPETLRGRGHRDAFIAPGTAPRRRRPAHELSPARTPLLALVAACGMAARAARV
jgi:hypothetical protein